MNFRLSQKAFLWRTTVKYLIAGLILAFSYVSGLERLLPKSSERFGAKSKSLSKDNAPAEQMDNNLRWHLDGIGPEMDGNGLDSILAKEERQNDQPPVGFLQDIVKINVPRLDKDAQTKSDSSSTSPGQSPLETAKSTSTHTLPEDRAHSNHGQIFSSETESPFRCEMTMSFRRSSLKGNITCELVLTRSLMIAMSASSQNRKSADRGAISGVPISPGYQKEKLGPIAHPIPHTRTHTLSHKNQLQTTSLNVNDIGSLNRYFMSAPISPAPSAFIPPHDFNGVQTSNLQNSQSLTQIKEHSRESIYASTLPAPGAPTTTHFSNKVGTANFQNLNELRSFLGVEEDIESNDWYSMSASTSPAHSAFIPPHDFNGVQKSNLQNSQLPTQIKEHNRESIYASTLPALGTPTTTHFSNKAETPKFQNSPSLKFSDTSSAQSSLSYGAVQTPSQLDRKIEIRSTTPLTRRRNNAFDLYTQVMNTNWAYHDLSGVTSKSDGFDSGRTLPQGTNSLLSTASGVPVMFTGKRRYGENLGPFLEESAVSEKKDPNIKRRKGKLRTSQVDSDSSDSPYPDRKKHDNRLPIENKDVPDEIDMGTYPHPPKLEESDPVFRYAIPLFAWKRKTDQGFEPLPSPKMTSEVVTEIQTFLRQLDEKLSSNNDHTSDVAFRKKLLGRIEVSVYNFLYTIILNYRKLYYYKPPHPIEKHLKAARKWIFENWNELDFGKVRNPGRIKEVPHSKFKRCAYTYLKEGKAVIEEDMIFAVFLMIDWLRVAERDLSTAWGHGFPKSLYTFGRDGRYCMEGTTRWLERLKVVSYTVINPDLV
ncbi:hypothetical protein CROQUDRAFT_718968 [Cronartium quercuum f. sp. fusiforme G11]|uniref:Uncharacterized protein n=1 Tax=Cronartium quercuum f. sp. fusiforme G11 TaxID=708437 RepID=A0A9P6N694_9BASI|nr:hypothetical protein CROQUDRAFT_718968 [Cronartium quercuum f. sp. fusiforme G11]